MLFLPRGSIKQIIEADIAKRNSPRLFVFFGLQNNQDGTVGMAYIGTLCASQNQVFYRASINEYFVDDITTAEIVAHEIGKYSAVPNKRAGTIVFFWIFFKKKLLNKT